MEHNRKAAAANAHAAAELAKHAATAAGLAEIDAKKAAACDLVAKIHEGEAIVPKAFNPWDGGQASGERLESRVSQAMEEIRGWSAAAFRSAALQPESDEAGRRFIEHGAMCYANCFLRIQRALGAALTPP
ncbi:hypothetical protein HMPREF9701_04892 [Delftia acidovorans CCUG 274B]|uniref:hypothetical protein n=1 Tax=Delftia acidovorans TaxID=80866 RepID=UPI000352C891|nr:hypothetical protein [Delftia acidovorans]EPD36073.1 hypothetical protein HMPREF9701_04892 [Delftia acidovorans CCUG 274B]